EVRERLPQQDDETGHALRVSAGYLLLPPHDRLEERMVIVGGTATFGCDLSPAFCDLGLELNGGIVVLLLV
ncbi:MAG: hypothetical protein AAFW98_10280, partial [Pseudomonadota bacterium]